MDGIICLFLQAGGRGALNNLPFDSVDNADGHGDPACTLASRRSTAI